MCRRPVVVSTLRSLRHPIGLHLAKLRPGRTRRKHRGRLRDEEEISVSMQPTHQHHPSSCADSSFVAAKGSTKMASRLGRVAVDVEQAEEERLLPQRQPLLPCPRTCKAQQPTADDTSKARHGKVQMNHHVRHNSHLIYLPR
ncbi:uncharacterized protein LOC119312306 [Triticum dicoccoides]|uniref:uncharacterized protein LOC119312306 n=1 Tax=Triticum dicoccoides TaxID=85692 RepID=UPI001891A528|nr:uncharacterized protein LOC119312306 [Triticum dicoccoides]XP_037443925.1 uncharacterized protein LOC119312306 [Triticum dicoccoides]